MATATADSKRDRKRPPAPDLPPGGNLAWWAVPDLNWRVAAEGARCRWHGPASGHTACGKPAAGEKHQPNDSISPWWAHCAGHMRDRWAEDGHIFMWELRHADATPLTAEEAGRVRAMRAGGKADECAQHHCPRDECPPSSRHGHPMRFRTDTWGDVEDAAGAGGTDATTWVTRAMEVTLGYLRCYRCDQRGESPPPVPVVFGDLEGKPLREWVPGAVKAAEAQHPDHGPVTIGMART